MSNLHARIAALVPRMSGWCSVEKANDLALAVIKMRATTVVEIGVFGGRSALPLAMALQEQNHGTLWAIDPWDAVASTEGYDKTNADWWAAVDHETIYRQFLAFMKSENVEPFVKVIRQRSDDVQPPEEICCLHLDGQHTLQAVKDIQRFAPKVKMGGYVFVDDIKWGNGEVGLAVQELLKMGFIKLFDRDTGAMFQRVEQKVAAKKKKGRGPGKKRKLVKA